VGGPFAERADEFAVFDAAGAGGFAGETAETAVGVGESLFEREGSFEDVLDEEDAAARGFGFLSVDLIGGAGGETEAAMDASLDGVGHGLACWSRGEDGDGLLHGVESGRNLRSGSRAEETRDSMREAFGMPGRTGPGPRRRRPESARLDRMASRAGASGEEMRARFPAML
jgi:hypothetical protein